MDLKTDKKFRNFQRGSFQVPLMVAVLVMALAVPVATKLVSRNQNPQSRALGTDCSVCDGLNNGTAKISCYENCTNSPLSSCEDDCKRKTVGEAAFNYCVKSECTKKTVTTAPPSSGGSSGGSFGGTTSTSGGNEDSVQAKKTSSSSKCTEDSKAPADKCSSSQLQINPECLNGKWDYDVQSCNAQGRVEVCGGKQYCCPSKGGKWTTNLSKCPNACLECPKDFACYKKDDVYKWYVSGYVPEGYSKVASSNCTKKKVAKPTFKGKLKGDANCDGLIDETDLAVWKEEYLNGKDDDAKWQADFTGKNGKCDQMVNGYDYSLWRRQYIDLKGK